MKVEVDRRIWERHTQTGKFIGVYADEESGRVTSVQRSGQTATFF